MTATATKTAASLPLWEQGYRVRAGVEPLTLIVRNPAGVRYIVNPVTEECSCPWWTHRASVMGGERLHTCKHIREIKSLVLSEWGAVNDSVRHEAQMWMLITRLDEIEAAQRAAKFAPIAQSTANCWSNGRPMTAQELSDLGRAA